MTTKNVHTALIEFQKKGIKIGKDKSNPYFKSKYADISTILYVVQQPLAECGLYIFNQQSTEHPNMLITAIVHAESETHIQTMTELKTRQSNMQEVGSALTYARRYALANLLSLLIDDPTDDDGENNYAGENNLREKYDKAQKEITSLKKSIDNYSKVVNAYEEQQQQPQPIPPDLLERAVNAARAGELSMSKFNETAENKKWELKPTEKARIEQAIKEYNEEKQANEEIPF